MTFNKFADYGADVVLAQAFTGEDGDAFTLRQDGSLIATAITTVRAERR
jgi:hypothetical protein